MNFEFWMMPGKVIPAGRLTLMFLKARYAQRDLAHLPDLKLVMIANDGCLASGDPAHWNEYETVPFRFDSADPAKLLYSVTPQGEGELRFRLLSSDRVIAEWSLFAVHKDLLGMQALRGDLHVHSSCSECGCRDEDPLYVAAWGRKRGLDFMAITDHVQREPSVAAAEFIRGCGSDFQVFPGEETHVILEHRETLFCKNGFQPHNHIVSIGASQGIIRYANDHFEEYMRAIRTAADALPARFPEKLRFVMAGADYLINKIHEFGGMAIFAHPFWRPCGRLNLPAEVREYILQQNKFDAMEVIGLGGDSTDLIEGNFRCIAWWQQACMQRGRLIPLVGNTDSHQTRKLLGRQYSIVFAEKNDCEHVCNAIRAGRSVACTHYPEQPLAVYGDHRLVTYAEFLEREVFPEHDAACEFEGAQMLAGLEGRL